MWLVPFSRPTTHNQFLFTKLIFSLQLLRQVWNCVSLEPCIAEHSVMGCLWHMLVSPAAQTRNMCNSVRKLGSNNHKCSEKYHNFIDRTMAHKREERCDVIFMKIWRQSNNHSTENIRIYWKRRITKKKSRWIPLRIFHWLYWLSLYFQWITLP